MIDKYFHMYHSTKYVDINQNLAIIDALPRNSCETNFSETRDDFFFDLRTPKHKVMMALKIILMKIGLSDIFFVLDVK